MVPGCFAPYASHNPQPHPLSPSSWMSVLEVIFPSILCSEMGSPRLKLKGCTQKWYVGHLQLKDKLLALDLQYFQLPNSCKVHTQTQLSLHIPDITTGSRGGTQGNLIPEWLLTLSNLTEQSCPPPTLKPSLTTLICEINIPFFFFFFFFGFLGPYPP